MIRFIATDLDGTLLDPAGELPREATPLIARLADRGVFFAPASGRQYANLARLFSPVRERILFVCENGALVKRGEKTLYLAPLSPAFAKNALDAVRAVGGLFPILCGEKSAYIENREEPFRTRALLPYTACEEVDDLDGVIGREPICKISVYDGAGARTHAMTVLPDRLKELNVILSGEHWCDVAAPEADKGKALRVIQKTLDVSPDECMAFGDQMNDLAMFAACTHTRAVANACPAVRAAAEAVVPSNAEGGVLKELQRLLSAPAGEVSAL